MTHAGCDRGSRPNVPKPEPIIFKDERAGKNYKRGPFLGKGGFAKCYEVVDMATGEVLAAKVVSKGLLKKDHQREKMSQEIRIHRSMNQKHIVKFFSYFEDSENVYMILELCRKKSLMEMHKRRRAITEPEVRYIMKQIIDAVVHLHKSKVIHRDLKLGNLFINDDMEIKIGDFGLATRVDFNGERKRTLCGTPNYIAPEVLKKEGHSYEVDMWSIGCIMYTLLVGKPPFETSSLKDTYSKIKRNEYYIPPKISNNAQILIVRLLRPEPSRRPSAEQCLTQDFFTQGYCPTFLPTSCLMMPPHFDTKISQQIESANRKPLNAINQNAGDPHILQQTAEQAADAKAVQSTLEVARMNLMDLKQQLSKVMATAVNERWDAKLEEDLNDPMSAPLLWISKWVDYSDKYGLGYQLCNNTSGVLFNDMTRLQLAADGASLQYIDRDGKEYFYKNDKTHETKDIAKKLTLLGHFMHYMHEHLLTTGRAKPPQDVDNLARWPCLHSWFRTSTAIVLFLNNGTLQLNFFTDHTKIILCPKISAVSYINPQREMKTFTFENIQRHGASHELNTRLNYAVTIIRRMMASENQVGRLFNERDGH